MLAPQLKPASWIDSPKTLWLEDACLPQLIIYVDLMTAKLLKNPKEWVHLFHQTAGYACDNVTVYAKLLPIKKGFFQKFKSITDKYLDSCISSPPSLSTAQLYDAELKKLGLSADHCYHHLQEGFYPIDIQHIHKLTAKLPQTLDSLLLKPEKSGFYCPAHWNCALLGPNCD